LIFEKAAFAFLCPTCFSFLHQPISEKGQSVLKHAQALFPDQITSARSIRSPVGFIHGYDITQLLLAALHQVGLTSDAETHRRAVRSALENLEQPVVGLVKTYQSPYQVFSDTNTDAHEALSRDDYCMAYYDNSDDVVVVNR